METRSCPLLVIFEPVDIPVAASQLVRAVRALTPRNGAPPQFLLGLADQVNREHRARQAAAAGTGAALPQACPGAVLTVAEAAAQARVSDSFLRRCCRERVHFAVERDWRSGAWEIDAASFASWLAARRRHRERAAAA